MDYFDPFNPPLWGSPPDPKATKIGNVVPDPAYPVPLEGIDPARRRRRYDRVRGHRDTPCMRTPSTHHPFRLRPELPT